MSDVGALMNQTALRLATRVYRATPFQPLRAAYFRAFLRLVRGRHVVRRVEDMTFELDLGEMIDACVFLQQYERDLVVLIERLAKPGSVVLDIGANIGAHTLRFAKHVGARGRVYAFEPMDYAYQKLVRNISLNATGNTQSFRLALSDHAVAPQPVSFRSSWATDGMRKDQTNVVEFTTLDTWAAEHGVNRVDLIKLDVDGHEYPVLAGGIEMLRASRPIVLIEAGACHFANSARNPLGLLSDLSYRFWDTKSLVEYPDLNAIRTRLPEHDHEMAFSINVLAMTAPLSAHE